MRTLRCIRKEIVPPSDCERSNCSLVSIIVNFQYAVVTIAYELLPLVKRVFDGFTISSGDLDYSHREESPVDFLLHADDAFKGTLVNMEIAADSHNDIGAIFDEYSSGPDEYRFERTVVPVRLALYEGERLVSRSQAKRILNRVERFRYVILDFEGVDTIGQAFADEVFRVFANRHPEIKIMATNESEQIGRMINRALSAS